MTNEHKDMAMRGVVVNQSAKWLTSHNNNEKIHYGQRQIFKCYGQEF